MAITYRIDVENRLIEEKWVGAIDASGLRNYWINYLADPAVLEIRKTIVDLRDSIIMFNGYQLQNLIELHVLPILKGRDWRTAIVVDNPLQFGVSRQYQAFADKYSKDAIFKNMEEARRWLLSQK